MNKLQKINKEYINPDILNMEKGLLLEENRRLEQKIDELEKKMEMKSELKIISAECVGGYNDTTIYNVTINYYGKNEIVTLEKSYHDMQEPINTWEVFTTLELSDEEKNKIIDVVSKDPPSIFSDVPPKIYNHIDSIQNESMEEIDI